MKTWMKTPYIILLITGLASATEQHEHQKPRTMSRRLVSSQENILTAAQSMQHKIIVRTEPHGKDVMVKWTTAQPGSKGVRSLLLRGSISIEQAKTALNEAFLIDRYGSLTKAHAAARTEAFFQSHYTKAMSITAKAELGAKKIRVFKDGKPHKEIDVGFEISGTRMISDMALRLSAAGVLRPERGEYTEPIMMVSSKAGKLAIYGLDSGSLIKETKLDLTAYATVHETRTVPAEKFDTKRAAADIKSGKFEGNQKYRGTVLQSRLGPATKETIPVTNEHVNGRYSALLDPIKAGSSHVDRRSGVYKLAFRYASRSNVYRDAQRARSFEAEDCLTNETALPGKTLGHPTANLWDTNISLPLSALIKRN